MLSALIRLAFALAIAVYAFVHHETMVGIVIAAVGILSALYRVRRGG